MSAPGSEKVETSNGFDADIVEDGNGKNHLHLHNTRASMPDDSNGIVVASIPFAVVTIVATVFLPSIKKYQTNRVAVSL